MVYQGTVLGTSLCHVFFSDVLSAVCSIDGFADAKFADDLGASNVFPAATCNDDILSEHKACQLAVHSWGARNRVEFDQSKEEFCVLDSQGGHGAPFRLLGPIIDNKLLMQDCVEAIYKRAKPKSKRLVRERRFFTQKQLVIFLFTDTTHTHAHTHTRSKQQPRAESTDRILRTHNKYGRLLFRSFVQSVPNIS